MPQISTKILPKSKTVTFKTLCSVAANPGGKCSGWVIISQDLSENHGTGLCTKCNRRHMGFFNWSKIFQYFIRLEPSSYEKVPNFPKNAQE